MKRFYMGAVFAALVVAVWECAGDPTASLRGGPASLNITPRQIYVDTGKSVALTVTARDAQLNPVPVVVSVTSASPAVAKVTYDTTRPFIDSATYAYVIAAGSPGQSKLTITGGGLTDSAVVNVLPLAFNGVISNLTPKGGDTITVRSTAVLKFDPATVAVTFGGPQAGIILFKSADSVRVLTPFSDPAPLTIDGVVVTFVAGLKVSLPSSGTVHQTGDYWAADSSWQTAPDITPLLPASGKSSIVISTPAPSNAAVCPEFALGFGSSGPCMMFKFTLADTATLNFTTDWEGTASAPDVDIYACADSTVANFGAACFEDGGAGATGAKPQTTGAFKYPAGTHYFVIENYAGSASKNLRTTIARP